MRTCSQIAAILAVAFCCGCGAQRAVDPPDEQAPITSPPPSGLESNPARPDAPRP